MAFYKPQKSYDTTSATMQIAPSPLRFKGKGYKPHYSLGGLPKNLRAISLAAFPGSVSS